jgi:hypothetical protein
MAGASTRVALPLALALLLAAPGAARAWEVNDDLEVYGYAQIWLTIVEQMEDARGLFQHPSGDEAVHTATGFRLNRARVGLDVDFADELLAASLLFKLEGAPGILDLVIAVRPLPWLSVLVGQFKVPSTAENLTSDRHLPFVLRTDLSGALADYSLSRTIYTSSLLHGNRSYSRDLGVGLLLHHEDERFAFRGRLMVGNGLGANLFISGQTARGFLITNRSQFLYAGRLELEPIRRRLIVGGHVSWNRHDDAVFNSGRTVFDLHRLSASGDVEIRVAEIGLRGGGQGGWGAVLEDANGDDRVDYRYFGGSGWVSWNLMPMLRAASQGRWSEQHHLTLSYRYERFTTQVDEASIRTHRDNHTIGVGWQYRRWVKLQLEIVRRVTDAPYEVDLDDDLVLLSAQFAL